MVRTKIKMSSDIKEAFTHIKPICDALMVSPSVPYLESFKKIINGFKLDVLQELQQYLMFPLISHIKNNDVKKDIIYLKMLENLIVILEKITINSFEMYIKIETALLGVIFDSNKPGMNTEEDIKLLAVKSLTSLMLHIPNEFRFKLLNNNVPMLAQVVFVCVQIARHERLRRLRIAAIQCVLAHTMTHPDITEEYRIPDQGLELLVVDNMLVNILPGVLAALQDVCCCTSNPTHNVVTAGIEAVHRILCLPMHNKYFTKKPVSTNDFVNMLKEKKAKCDPEVTNRPAEKNPKDIEKRSDEWYEMAGDKLTLITKSLVHLRVYDHHKVRLELAVFCYRILNECNSTMVKSLPLCLDVLISLTNDEYAEVANYCSAAVHDYFTNTPEPARNKTMDTLCDNFISLLISLPRVMNNIDESRKMSVLNLLYGYIEALCSGRPQRLTGALSVASHMQHLCTGLSAAAQHDTRLVRHTRPSIPDVSGAPSPSSPWSRLVHVSARCEARLQAVCRLLGGAQCADLVLDALLERLRRHRDPEPVYILNWMIASSYSTASMARRIIQAYIEQEVWCAPLDVRVVDSPAEHAVTGGYKMRAWTKQSVPDLYEGTVEIRYTEMPYLVPRAEPSHDPRYCGTLMEAQRNLVLSCLLTEGIGLVATRLQDGYDNFLLKTLCPLLERVGSDYELLHLAGLKALYAVARACGHDTPTQLISVNADYFTSQVTARLKKAWSCQSALKILSVVMEYSDSSIAPCLYGIVSDVLVQSCDKYYESELQAYLQVFLTFTQCIRKWYPDKQRPTAHLEKENVDLLTDVRNYVRDTLEAERLLSDTDFEKSTGKTTEELYWEDIRQREQDLLDYDDSVTKEKPPTPQHVLVTIAMLKRSLNFITSPQRDVAILALQILNQGLPILAEYEDELLPLVHQTWSPLVERFQCSEAVVLRRALHLLVTLASLAKDFIHARTVKEVLPEIYKYLYKSYKDSYLKDKGSSYRNSHAYTLQVTALDALPSLVVDLGLADEKLTEAMNCVQIYLSNKQPKTLQASAVKFFKAVLEYEYPAAWYHLRSFCRNNQELEPPDLAHIEVDSIVGTPYGHHDKDYDGNIKLIFNKQ